MKLGSLVLTTSQPLSMPIRAATTSEVSTATQMFTSSLVARTPTTRPVVPTIAPAERSNSPPIINSATATAMMPNWADDSSQVEAPPAVRKRPW